MLANQYTLIVLSHALFSGEFYLQVPDMNANHPISRLFAVGTDHLRTVYHPALPRI